MKLCKYCNKEFESLYTTTTGYSYTSKTTVYCSKSCAGKDKKILTKQEIEQEIVDFVTEKNRYCTRAEILKGIKRSSKTLTSLNISITDIQSALCFTKPKSIFQEKIYTWLKKKYSNIECEKTFRDLVSPKGYALRLDFYIESLNLIIEADGLQHVDKNNPWYSEYLSACDSAKDTYAEAKCINIVRIPYVRNVSDDYIEQYLADFI